MYYRELLVAEKRRWVRAVAGASVAVLTAMPALSTPEPIQLREQLNQTYGPELISVSFHAGNQECVLDGIQLTGPQGSVAVQLSDLEFWPGENKFVKSARLWFIADDLKPLTTATYTPTVKTAKATAVSSRARTVSRSPRQPLVCGCHWATCHPPLQCRGHC